MRTSAWSAFCSSALTMLWWSTSSQLRTSFDVLFCLICMFIVMHVYAPVAHVLPVAYGLGVRVLAARGFGGCLGFVDFPKP